SVAWDMHPDDFEYIPFHTPFPGMVRKAGLLGYRHMIRDTEIEDGLADEIGRQPREAEFEDWDEYEDAIRDYMDDLKRTDTYQSWYGETIGPTLSISREVGNWYTGSVHVARASALKHAAENGIDLAGEKLLVGSYGSGAQAEIHAETVRDGWLEEIRNLNIDEQLDARYDLGFEEYEQVHNVHNHEKSVDVEEFTIPDGEFVYAGQGRMNERMYDYVE
ncbi:MAG: hydroxymethylglutaryl-CoA synthase, partial [Halolamina sp.]